MSINKAELCYIGISWNYVNNVKIFKVLVEAQLKIPDAYKKIDKKSTEITESKGRLARLSR